MLIKCRFEMFVGLITDKFDEASVQYVKQYCPMIMFV